MNSLFNTALKQTTSLRRDLATFAASPSTAPASTLGQISASLTALSRTLDDYIALSRHEPPGPRKDKASARIASFQHDLGELRREFARLRAQRDEMRAGELLRGRHGASAAAPENPYATAGASVAGPWAPAVTSHHALAAEDHAFRERDFLGRTGGQLDEFIEQGRQVLAELGQQREVLKGAQRRLYGVANTLGVSGETIRRIERRAREDRWIFWTGCVVFFGFCWVVLRYLR